MEVTYDIVEKTAEQRIPEGWYLRQTIYKEKETEKAYIGPFKSERDVVRYALAHGPHNNPFRQQDGSLEINLGT